MKITHKLTLLALLPPLLLLLVAALALTTYDELAEAQHTSSVAETIETRVFALGMLTYDYLRHREERARVQWRLNHQALGRALEEAHLLRQARPVVQRLRTDHAALGADFDRLVAHQGQSARTNPVWQEQESWLMAQLLLRTQTAFSDAVKLRSVAEQCIGAEQDFFLSVTLALLALAGVLISGVAWATSRGIGASLRRLHRAADEVAGGNLDYHAETGTHDEHGRLAQALNAMAAELKVTQQQVIQAEKLSALGTLAAGIAHELNNPLMGVMGYVARARASTADPEALRVLERAERELQRMGDLLKNMLGFARPVAERSEAVELAPVIEHALALMQADFRARGVTVATEIAPQLPLVRGGRGSIQQVLMSLLSNARDALEGRQEKRVRIIASLRGERVTIAVEDSGCGVPERMQGRIFDPFFTTKPPGRGTGLGLAVARNIMVDLGGTLTCHSREGEGATFTAELPVAGRSGDGHGQAGSRGR